MRNSERKILSVLIIMFLFLSFDVFFHISTTYYLLFFLFLTILSVILLGYKKDIYLYKIDIIQLTIIYCITFLVLLYLSGLYFGFNKTPYNLEILKILKNIIPIIIIIFLEEIFRYIILKKTKKKFLIITLIILFILLNIVNNYQLYPLETPLDIYDFAANLVIISICKNIVFTYATYKTTLLFAIIYRLIFETFTYLLPITPDLGIYLESILNILFLTILFLRLNTFLTKKKSMIANKNKLRNFIIITPIFTILLIFVMLSSNLFKHSLIAIASNSMNPSIKRGDAIIIEKNDLLDNLKLDDILVYKHDGKTIIHRLIEIRKINDKYIFRTKGDNNSNVDNYDIQGSDVIGKGIFVIPAIGYPSVWLSEKMR